MGLILDTSVLIPNHAMHKFAALALLTENRRPLGINQLLGITSLVCSL
jgi:hypothetical protein